jgi:hypothetical protein
VAYGEFRLTMWFRCSYDDFFRRFPKAGVWPPLPSGAKHGSSTGDDEFLSQLPEPAMQKHLVDLYFTHVHPSFPVIHRSAFFELFQARYATLRTCSL